MVHCVYMILQQIYSGNYVANFIKIAQIFSKILQMTFWPLFSKHSIGLCNVNADW